MNNNLKKILIVLCLFILSVSLIGCHVPGLKSKPTEAPAPETTGGESPSEAPSETAPEAPENTQSDETEEEPMITNPGRSSLMPGKQYTDAPVIRPASMQIGSSAPVRNAQIVRPTASANTTAGDGILIQNDHKVTYPEQQSVIQKSVPSGHLQPMSYIPPTRMNSGQSIAFSPGATSAVISGYVPAGGYVSYNLYAFQNQNFLVLLSSDSGSAVLSVTDIYGNVYLDANQRQNSYNMYLPRTATYYVNIHSTGYSENFTLQIFIPARVTIPVGKTSAVMSGTVSPYSVVSYTAYMYAGQTARIDDYSGAQPTSFLRISGLQSGVVYMDYTAYSPSWYSVVPATQDYLIEVISMDQTSNYTLTVDVR